MSITKGGTTEVELHEEPNNYAVEMKTYILDDFKALKKKFSMINHNPSIDINGEASNGASINVDMKTSLFELLKQGFCNYLKNEVDIQKVELPVTSKAQSKNGDEADVEYHVDVTFVVSGISEKVKMKCFTTNCRIQVQNFGKHARKEHLGKEFSPRYFVDRFVVPFLESVMEKAFEFDKVFVPHLRAEIQRLQKRKIQDRVRKTSALDTDPKNTKCVNTCCQWINVILKNVEAYGICVACQGYEHHHCAGTSKLMKEEIKNGQANFFCTVCIEKNPALGKDIAVTNPKMIENNQVTSNQQSATEVQALTFQSGGGTVGPCESMAGGVADHHLEMERNQTASSESVIINSESRKCKHCEYSCELESEMTFHVAEKHPVQNGLQVKCKDCGKDFTDISELQTHEQSHEVSEDQCDQCDYSTCDKELLITHMNFAHETPTTINCTVCNNCFNSKADLEEHMKLHDEVTESYQCDICAFKAVSKGDLEKHRGEVHTSITIVSSGGPDKVENENNESVEAVTRKLKMMEDSYDRLMALYTKQQNEYKANTLVLKSELENTYESLRVAKKENEKLKDINDTQHKLWKIFVNKFEEKEAEVNVDKEKLCKETMNATKQVIAEEIEIVEDDNEDETEETYQKWLENTRKRGFKRSSPASPPERNVGENVAKNVVKKSYAEVAASKGNKENQEKLPEKPSQSFVRYCHNWNNFGKCNFERCRFAHENAPICTFDGNCTRSKCMFTHKKQNMHFLSKRTQVNPWQTMGGSWSNPFSFPPNPWMNPTPPNPWINPPSSRRN